MEEEYIEVPYGRDARESVDDSRDRSQEGGVALTDGEPDSASDYPISPRSPPTGLNGLSARLKGVEDDDDDSGVGKEDYFDKASFGRTSASSDRSAGMPSRVIGGRTSVAEDQERMRRDYEYKIATMQSQISTLQRDLGDVDQKERNWKEGELKVQQMEEELAGLRRVSTSSYHLRTCPHLHLSVRKNKALRCVPCKRN